MSQPPKGASLLFGAQSTTAIFDASPKRNGKAKLTLNDIERIEWFTNRPIRKTGTWKPERLTREWDQLFMGEEPNAIAGFNIGNGKAMVAFEMFKPKWNKTTESLSFRLQPLDARQRDKITGLDQIELSDISLFIDDTSTNQPPWYPNGQNLNFTGVNFSGMNLSNASMENSVITNTNLDSTDLSGANLSGAFGTNISGSNANFSEAVLLDTTMSSSDFNGGNFFNVNAQDVDFANSNLSGANFQDAFLFLADFQSTNLTGADFTGANINGANFSGATWSNTICPDGSLNSGTSPCSTQA